MSVYDLNGEPLFYDFPVFSSEREPLGLIRTGASRVIGIPVLSAYLGATRWDAHRAIAKASEVVEKEYRGKVISIRLVCYAYPKLGIDVVWQREGARSQRAIMDVGDFSIVHLLSEDPRHVCQKQ